MKRPFILAILVLCVMACAVLLPASRHAPKPSIVAGFQGSSKGTPNWAVDSWFIQASSQRAELMQRWFESGTNAAQLGITNNSEHAIRVSPLARFETAEQQMDTPVLTARDFRGVSIGPREAKSIQVASLPHSGTWASLVLPCSR